MKKLTRKLFLSVAALAVCAATLVSTTFAWYVSNQTATAKSITAATAAVSDDGSVYISKDGSNFYSSISFIEADYSAKDSAETPKWANQKAEFNPITTEDGVTFNLNSKTGDTVNTTTSGYMVINLWLKADADCTVTPNLQVTNTTGITETQKTAVLPTKVAYQQITSAIAGGSNYTIDAVQALRMAVTTDSKTTIYDVEKIAKDATDVTKAYTVIGDVKEGALSKTTIGEKQYDGAHGYYTAIMGEEPTDMTPAAAEATWGEIKLTKDTPVQLTIKFWLDGADISCYDGCAGQTFKFDFDFTVKKKTQQQG